MLITRGRAPVALVSALGGTAAGDGVYEVNNAAGAILRALGGVVQ